ncbi:hypothetical protein [Sediminibacillus massiliensis]|nr:hypothetical protein [Sediminibacillus massiliensis]
MKNFLSFAHGKKKDRYQDKLIGPARINYITGKTACRYILPFSVSIQ